MQPGGLSGPARLDAGARAAGAGARVEIERPAMAGTDQAVALDEAVREQAAVVGAAIGRGERAPIRQGHQDQVAGAAPACHDLARAAARARLRHRGPRRRGRLGIFPKKIADLGMDAGLGHEDTACRVGPLSPAVAPP